MIWLNDAGEIVIKTEIAKKDVYEVVQMKRSVLELLETQDSNFYNRDSNYWAFKLIELLEFEPEQICFNK